MYSGYCLCNSPVLWGGLLVGGTENAAHRERLPKGLLWRYTRSISERSSWPPANRRGTLLFADYPIIVGETRLALRESVPGPISGDVLCGGQRTGTPIALSGNREGFDEPNDRET